MVFSLIARYGRYLGTFLVLFVALARPAFAANITALEYITERIDGSLPEDFHLQFRSPKEKLSFCEDLVDILIETEMDMSDEALIVLKELQPQNKSLYIRAAIQGLDSMNPYIFENTMEFLWVIYNKTKPIGQRVPLEYESIILTALHSKSNTEEFAANPGESTPRIDALILLLTETAILSDATPEVLLNTLGVMIGETLNAVESSESSGEAGEAYSDLILRIRRIAKRLLDVLEQNPDRLETHDALEFQEMLEILLEFFPEPSLKEQILQSSIGRKAMVSLLRHQQVETHIKDTPCEKLLLN